MLLLCFTVMGILVYDDYGISWDEPMQRSYGQAAVEYALEGDTTLHQHDSRYHGPAFQMLLYSVEQTFATERTAYKIRHLFTFLFSVVGLAFFYKLLLALAFKPHWAGLGIIFLACSPRILAHSFYNSKDAVFMYMFIVCIYFLVRFLQKPSFVLAIALGLCTGILIDIRILGLFVPIFLIGIWLIRSVRDFAFAKKSAGLMVLSGSVSLLAIVAFWPTLWHNPIAEFGNALAKMGDYPWDDFVLFEGVFAQPLDLPWYYLPKWVIISTPLAVLLFSALGLLPWLLDRDKPVWTKLLPVIWLVPFVIIVAKGATVYDGWRHVFFLYPALLILAVAGAKFAFSRWSGLPFVKWIPVAVAFIPLVFIVRSHPHQQVYFNPLATENAWHNYEMDYWGLSYKQALEYVCETKPEGDLRLSVANSPGRFNQMQLKQADIDRIVWLNRDSADFFLSNFRFPGEHKPFVKGDGAYAKPLLLVKVDDNPIMGVFDCRN
ncbi:MAG: ArnT family glycosyltransferase [Flavobacteriales bacterium]